MIIYPSGARPRPKGVVLTHASFSSYVVENVTPADPDPGSEERVILTVPLYHIAGLQALMAAVYGGRTVVVQPQFEPEGWLKLVQDERVTRAMLVPTMLRALIDHPSFGDFDLSSLRVITYGAAAMPGDVLERAIAAFPQAQLINAFGQTESAATITMLGPDDHVLAGTPGEIEKKRRRLRSIGRPLPDVEVRVVDEQGEALPPGVTGEIVARGARLMKGYWERPEATAEALRGGWLHTGDLGYRDEDGYIFLKGRAREIIKRGGEMISPEEVEEVIERHPAVVEAAVIGVPDTEWGEVVEAVVVVRRDARVTEGELIEHCRRQIASFKKPEAVHFMPALPRNQLGKVLRGQLRDRFGRRSSS
jgi:acyl-CoA synthetase (AMP-forming)/AMP-acid ligase II